MSDDELNMHCTEGTGCQISNPFYGSFAETKGVMMTPEQVEEANEAEYEEEEDPINCDLNLPSGFFEE